MAQSFDQWLDEIEVFSSRRERAIDDLGPEYEKWLLAAWLGGSGRRTHPWCRMAYGGSNRENATRPSQRRFGVGDQR